MGGICLEELFIMCYKKDSFDIDNKKEYEENLKLYIKENLEKNMNIYIKDIELIRKSFNFRVLTTDNERIFFNFTGKSFVGSGYICEIIFNNKYSLNIKMNKNIIEKSIY